MNTRTWILTGAIGTILVVLGFVLSTIVVTENQDIGLGIKIPVQTRPFNTIGMVLAIGGGIILAFSIIGFIIKYSKESTGGTIPPPPPPTT